MLFPRIVQIELAGGGERLRNAGLMISFDFSREANAKPAEGRVSIYNVRPETEAAIEEKYSHIRLIAGHTGRVGVILDGDILNFSKQRSGLDRIVEMEVTGNLNAIQTAFACQTWEGEVPMRTVVSYLVGKMNLGLEPMTLIPAGEMVEDYCVCENAGRALTKLLARLTPPVVWYEDLGTIRFRKRGQFGVSKTSAIVVSAQSGMVGTPGEVTDGLQVTTLLDHRAELDAPVRIRSEFYPTDGLWKICSLRHYGDSRGGDMNTEMELRAV